MQIKPPSFLIIPYQLIADRNVKPIEQTLYGVIYWLTKLKNEKCTASNESLAELVGTTAGVIQNSLTNLEKRGYIERTFKDRNKRVRDEIMPLIDFNTIVPGEIAPRPPRPNRAKIVVVESDETGKTINEIVAMFQPLNPSYDRLFQNKTQREVVERMVKKYGIEKLKSTIGAAVACYGKVGAPVITTPLQLETKLGSLIAHYRREGSESKLTKI